MRSCVLMRSPLLFHRTGVMCSTVLLRRSMLGHRSVLLRRCRVRRWRGLRLLEYVRFAQLLGYREVPQHTEVRKVSTG